MEFLVLLLFAVGTHSQFIQSSNSSITMEVGGATLTLSVGGANTGFPAVSSSASPSAGSTVASVQDLNSAIAVASSLTQPQVRVSVGQQ